MPQSHPPEFMRRYEREALAEGATTKLWPRPPLYLFAPGGRAERFARLFRETWRRVPLRDRRPIIAHWRAGPKQRGSILSPTVELVRAWEDTAVRGLGGVKAGVYNQGHELKFRLPLVAAYPDDLVRDLIAHELAHVWQYATGHIATGGDDEEARDEEGADELMWWWGFEPYAMDEWDLAHGIIRVIDISKMSPGVAAGPAWDVAGSKRRGSSNWPSPGPRGNGPSARVAAARVAARGMRRPARSARVPAIGSRPEEAALTVVAGPAGRRWSGRPGSRGRRDDPAPLIASVTKKPSVSPGGGGTGASSISIVLSISGRGP